MTQNELGVTEIFNATLKDEARKVRIRFEPFPLGGQDRSLLSDNLLARVDYFSLVEMKFSDRELITEAKKRERVSLLCKALETNARMRALHDQCHLIAWMETGSGKVRTSPYRDQICNEKVLPASGLERPEPATDKIVGVDCFAERFLGSPPSMCATKDEFQEYIEWLLQTVTNGDKKNIHVLARSKDANGETVGLTLKSLINVQLWLRGEPIPSTSPKLPRP